MFNLIYIILISFVLDIENKTDNFQNLTNQDIISSMFLNDTTTSEARFFHKDCEKIAEDTEKGKCANQKMYMDFYGELRYPALAREHGIQGTVEVSVTISKEGYIKDSRLIKDIGGGCGKAVVSYFEKMKEQMIPWIPALQGGVPVESDKIIPVNFKFG